MKIEFLQYKEDKMIDRHELEFESGVVVLKNKDKKGVIIPISDVASIRSKKPFYEIPENEMKIQRDFVVEIAKLLGGYKKEL